MRGGRSSSRALFPTARSFRRLVRASALAGLVALASLASPAAAQMVETLVTNITATSGFITDYYAQGFVTGSNTKRYTLTSVGIAIAGIVGANDTTTVKIRKNKVNNGENEPDNRNSGLVATLMNPSRLSAGTASFTAPANTTLDPNTRYWITTSEGVDYDSIISFSVVFDDSERGVTGWSIDNAGLFRTSEQVGWSTSGTKSMMIIIKGIVVGPTVTSILRQSPTALRTNADTLTWRVTFSEAVVNVDVADFVVSGTTATLAVSAVSGVTGAYDVTASGGDLASFNGRVTLSFASDQNIQDSESNALANTTPTGAQEASYEVDNSVPILGSASVNGRTLTLTYDETLGTTSVPAASAYTVTVAGATVTVSQVTISGREVRLTLPSGEVSTGREVVTVSYTKPSANPVQDVLGYPAAGFTNQAVTDATRPSLISILRRAPMSASINGNKLDPASTLIWRTTFSEPVAAQTNSFGVTPVAGAQVSTVTAVSGVTGVYAEVWDVTVTSSSGFFGRAGRHFTFKLSIADVARIRDQASNTLSSAAPTGENETYEIDNLRSTPEITGVPSTSTAPFTATISFTQFSQSDFNREQPEPVTGFDIGDITVTNATASELTATRFFEEGPWVFTVLITPTANATVTVDVPGGVAQDDAGNTNIAATQARSTHTDNTAPRVTSIVRQDPMSSPTNADGLTWRVTYSEAVENVDMADFAVDGTTATLAVSAVTGETGAYDVTASGGDLAGLDDPVTLSFAAGQNIQDVVGNALTNTTPTGTNNNSYVVDNTAPTAVSATANGTSLVITFSEDLAAAASLDNGAFTVERTPSGGTEETVTLSATIDPVISGNTVTVTLATASLSTDTNVKVSYTRPTMGSANKLADAAGNETASVVVAVDDDDAANTTPTASNGTKTTNEDTPYAFDADDFNFSDTDAGDALASVKITTLPQAGKGSLALDGTAVTADQAIAASDLGKLTYTPPANANGSDYASFTFKVSDGTAESAASYTMTLDVTAVNDPATGLPTISGTARVGQLLTAGVSAIADDADGLPEVSTFTWQWLQVSGGSDTAISGATSQTYTVAAADAGKKFKVQVSFTDLDGHPEALTSVAYPADRQVSENAAPTGSDKTVTVAEDGSYTFRVADFGFTDTDTGDALASVKITTLPQAGKGTLSLDGTAIAQAALPQTVSKADIDADKLKYTPAANANGAAHASFMFKVNDGAADSAQYTLTINVTAVNDDATGAPTVSGTATIGQTLTAAAGTVADADGVPAQGSFSWQWVRVDADGSSNAADIAGETATSYVLTAADEGKRVKVRAVFTDDGGTEETRESAAYPAMGTVKAASAVACPAPDLAGRRVLLRTEVTPANRLQAFTIAGYGYWAPVWNRPGAGAITAREFSIGTRSFRIQAVHVFDGFTDANRWDFGVGHTYFPKDLLVTLDAKLIAAEKAALRVHVCARPFDFSGTGLELTESEVEYDYVWRDSGFDWKLLPPRTLVFSVPVTNMATAAPTVEGMPVLTGPGEDGTFAAGDRIEASVTFDAEVVVVGAEGAPTLGIALGGVRREAAYASGSGTAALTFALTVSAADAGAGAAKAVSNGIRLNGGTIRSTDGSDAVLDYGEAPGIVSVEIGEEPGGDGRWSPGEAVEVAFTFAEPVDVGTAGGAPSVALALDGVHARPAAYRSGSGTDRLVFAYTLVEADGSTGSVLVEPDGLALNGGTIVSTGGLDAVLTHNGAGGIGAPRSVVPSLAVADAQASEGGTLAFRVALSASAPERVTVDWATADGPSPNGAAAGSDYTAGSGSLTFKPGETAKTVEVAVLTDSEAEGSETLTLTLSKPQGAIIGDGEATGTVTDLSGPAPLTASFHGVPPEHDGSSAFMVELRFSEEPAPGLSYKTVRDSLLAVAGGRIGKARRIEPPSNRRFELTVEPTGDVAVTLALAALRACGEAGSVCTADGRALSGALALSVPGPAALSVADAEVREGPGAVLAFAVTLDRERHAAATVDYASADGTSVEGEDYTAASGTLTFAAGETAKTVEVRVLNDAHDEGTETMTLALSNAQGARIADGQAVGTIRNTGAIPKAWIARFGRTVAEQVLDAVESRMRAARQPGAEVSLAGERIGLGPVFGSGPEPDGKEDEAALAAREKEAEALREAKRLADWLEGETDPEEERRRAGRSVTPSELLMGSSFALTAETAGKDLVSLWGRGAVTRFDGREGELTLDGEVVTGMLGADWTRGRRTAGLIVSHSVGEGGYSDGSRTGTGPGSASGTGGKVEATLTGLFPWARHALSDRLEAWGAAGYGAGELTVTPKKPGTDEDGAAIRADLDLRMAAAGLRGVLLDPGSGSGFQLTGKTDAMVVQTSSGRGKGADGGNMEPARATVTRLRLGLEASRPFALGPGSGSGAGGGAVLTPSLEVGVRHDGGDAETGFGLDLGGGLALSDPKRGLQAELRGRGLLAHESKGFRDLGFSGALAWEGKPGSDRGAKLRLTQTLGGSSSGGADALLARTTLEGLAANDNGAGGNDELKSRRLELKFGYGLSAFGDRFTWTPEVGVGLSDTGRDYSLGWRLVRGGFGGDGGSFELSFEVRRRESANDETPPEHEVGLRLSARW